MNCFPLTLKEVRESETVLAFAPSHLASPSFDCIGIIYSESDLGIQPEFRDMTFYLMVDGTDIKVATTSAHVYALHKNVKN